MFQMDNIIERQALLARVQKGIIVALCLLCLLLGWGWLQAPKHLTVYLPPDLTNGSVQKAHTIPKAFLYSFTFQVWQEINYWPSTHVNAQGDFPYKQNIHRYAVYLMPRFRRFLTEDYDKLKQTDHLDRTREMHSIINGTDVVGAVKQLTAHSWEVDVDMEVIERADNMVVKHAYVRYPLRVVRYDISREVNPFGLALAGFVREPERLDKQRGKNGL